MIDKIWEMILKEARSKPGDNIHAQLDLVFMEITIKVCDFLEEHDSHMYDDLPSEEELEKGPASKGTRWSIKKYDKNGRMRP